MKFDSAQTLPEVLKHSRTRVVFGAASLMRLGEVARAEGARHVLLVTDPGIVKAGHAERAQVSLRDAGIQITIFQDVRENPTTEHVDAGVQALRNGSPVPGRTPLNPPFAKGEVNMIVSLGGGSAMDCAKGINFVHTNGGKIADYWGVGKATKPMLPMIAIPTTAGTGSEAQSYALISDPMTHQKMACGDPKAACRVAILDPALTATQPAMVAAATGIDAVSHAVETAATTRRNDISLDFTREAWGRVSAAYEGAVRWPEDMENRAVMLLGAHLAGAAIEHSMLGAAHSCANPLTARCGVVHGVAVGIMLPHVVRFNSRGGVNHYAAICDDPLVLANRLEGMLEAGRLPRRLAECGVRGEILPQLAEEAATQWTARFNCVPVSAAELLEVYEAALK
jgi:alcohol dehydrogenase